MPRLLPRLLKRIKDPLLPRSSEQPWIPPKHRSTVVRQPPPPKQPSLAHEGRKQSIILDSLDPILKRSRYHRHKSTYPRLRVFTSPKKRRDPALQDDLFRAMSAEERAFWSSPYLRMLASPLRMCLLTRKLLPRAFLVRLAPKRLPTPLLGRSAQILVPEGLEHPQFDSSVRGLSTYALCSKAAIQLMAERGTSGMMMHSRVAQQVGHVLRVRVLQELHVLAGHLQKRPRGALDVSLVRRLTRAEWKNMKASGVAPYADAVALLVVPPLNRNPVTKMRPEPSASTAPPPVDEPDIRPARPSPPPTEMLPVAEDAFGDDYDLSAMLPSCKVPLYNGASLFPYRPQRAALHSSLLRLLDIERDARFGEQARTATSAREDKGSHAFLICSNAKSLKRADTVPLAIALWRLRLWEGAGWDIPNVGGWLKKP
ncbi:hypothetical protein WOLCODRAFT_69116 [Wolfiporia cocos MD-104 SS10]|uniref:Uncharacterized protein n=1 Tax=Wolfiporia cocos (strain MD-104) TaxID=742152 RepID=A0A2H3JN08_WOLCO|nr:hypothetical protein WOLCODRAFT_69116 [Wolfiporia cocos MD-104 SS10]